MYKRNRHSWTKHLDFMLLDLLCMHLAYYAAYLLRQGWGSNLYESELYSRLLLFMSLANLVIALGCSTYKNVLKRGAGDEFLAGLRQTILVLLFAMGYLFTVKDGDAASRFVLFATGILYLGVAYGARCVWKWYLRRRMAGNRGRSLLLVTVASRAEDKIRQLSQKGYQQFQLAGLVLLDGGEPGQEIGGVKVVANRDGAAEYVCREWIDEVLIDMPDMERFPRDLLEKFMEMGVVVHIAISDVFNPYGQVQVAERMCGMTVLTSGIRFVESSWVIIKRLVDICAGLTGSAVALILTVLLGPAIYIASPGPIFFKQERVGKNGKKFKMYKFRSMYLDAEERKAELLEQNNVKGGLMFKLDYDPRIIGCRKKPDGTVKKGLGNFLRDWSLDEWPQWFNVLTGSMSAVGTRPPTVDEWEKYELRHRQRLAIKPGVTGLWQVSGRSNITDFEDVVKLDAEYIANWSLKEDLKILFRTVGVVLRKTGAK